MYYLYLEMIVLPPEFLVPQWLFEIKCLSNCWSRSFFSKQSSVPNNFYINKIIYCDFDINYMLYWHFHFRNVILVNCFFTKWKHTHTHTHIVGTFGPWRWSTLNMEFVNKVKCTQWMQWQWFFRSRAGHA